MKPHNTVTATKPHGMVIMSEDLIEDGQEWECPDCDLIAPTLEELNLLDCTKAKPKLNPHAKPKDPHRSVTISEDRECKCAYCGLAAPSFEELNLLECKPGSAKPYPNPHRRLSLVPDDLGWDSREWQCDYCGKCAPHPEDLVGLPLLAVPMKTDPELILCTYVYPPCKNCKHGPTCWQWCRLYEPSLPPDEGEWPAELVAMSHEDLIRVVDLSNHLAESLSGLVASAYEYIFDEEWRRTARSLVAEVKTDIVMHTSEFKRFEEWFNSLEHTLVHHVSRKDLGLLAWNQGKPSLNAPEEFLRWFNAERAWNKESYELAKSAWVAGRTLRHKIPESENLAERLAHLVCAAYDYIGREVDEHFEKEWKRTAMDCTLVAEKLNTDVIKNCPEPPEDLDTLIGDALNDRICVEEIFSMGFSRWANAGTGENDETWLPAGGSLWLLPVNWYEKLPEELEFVSIYGVTVSRENGGATREHRMGCLSYGIIHREAE